MADIIKVATRSPHRKDELLELTAKWRAESGHGKPGWDSKAIHSIAGTYYGGLEQMFVKHGWPERGDKLMPNVQRHVKETYGDVEAFVAKHKD